ncbi:MAG: ATP-binding cassette subfamily B protein, partial [Chlamydiales bacterium]
SAPKPAPLRRLLAHARGHRRELRIASVCSVLNQILDIAPPFLIGAAVDIVVEREQSLLARMGVVEVSSQLWVLAGVTVVIWALESLFEYWLKVYWRNLAQTLQHELRLDAYAHVQKLDLAFFEDENTGSLLSVLNDDVNQLERFLNSGANTLIQVATTVVVVGVTFFYVAPNVAWWAFLPVPIILWGSFLFQSKIAPRYTAVRGLVGDLNADLAGNLAGIATIKSFVREDSEVERIRSRSDAYRAANRHAIALSSAFSPLIRMAIVIGFVATLVLGGMMVEDGSLPAGVYAVLVFITQRLLWPLTGLGEVFDQYQRAMASTTRVLDLLHTESSIHDGTRALDPAHVRGDLLLEHVTFAYAGREPLFTDVNIHFAAGKTTAVVGATGSGKSTLIKLLLRFYPIDSGRVTLDGTDLDELRLADLRGAIGLVSQDVFLFSGTVRENIAYGRPAASDAEIDEAARIADAAGFIAELPLGLDTVVGERGQKLSGGQRQRLSIARAVLKDAPILILDEATSSVDNETEVAIQHALERLSVGRTTIVIAHRLSTVRNADHILVLEGGGVIEQGRHDALVAQGGLYAALWRVQTGERDPAAPVGSELTP